MRSPSRVPSRVPVRSPSRTPSRWNVLVPLPLVTSQVRSCETTCVADWVPVWVAFCMPSGCRLRSQPARRSG